MPSRWFRSKKPFSYGTAVFAASGFVPSRDWWREVMAPLLALFENDVLRLKDSTSDSTSEASFP